MNRPRYYLQRDANLPEADLWADMADTQASYPKLLIYTNIDGKPAKLVTLPATAANRMVSVVEKFNHKILTIPETFKADDPHDNEGER